MLIFHVIDYTIPPYAFALVCTLSFSWVSDHYKNKPLFIMIFAAFDTAMFIIVAATTNHTIRCSYPPSRHLSPC